VYSAAVIVSHYRVEYEQLAGVCWLCIYSYSSETENLTILHVQGPRTKETNAVDSGIGTIDRDIPYSHYVGCSRIHDNPLTKDAKIEAKVPPPSTVIDFVMLTAP
jgi:hypothetical protein